MLRRMRYILPLTVILLFAVGKATTGGGDTGNPGPVTTDSPSLVEAAGLEKSEPARIGQSIRDGSFAFVVTSMQRPGRTLKTELGTTETAQGEFVVIRLTVTNASGEARPLPATSQFLVNSRGQRFAPSAVMTSMAGADTIFLKPINPGITVSGIPLLFDVDAGTTVTGIELHDSMSSTGVQVTLP